MAITWTDCTEKFDGLEVVSFRGQTDKTIVTVEELITGPDGNLQKLGVVGVRAYSRRSSVDILRTMHVPADPGNDPCATAQAKAEEFIKLFDL